MAGMLQVPLFSDETLPSWVARLARANGKLSSFSFCGDIGVDFSGLLLGRSTEIEALASVTGRATQELTEHALVFGAGHHVRLATESVSKKFMRKSQLAFCPKCFAADDVGNEGAMDTRRYWRKSWLMNDARACTLHGCRIENLPPHNRLHDLYQVLDRNSDAVADCVNAPTQAEPSLLDTFIAERLAAGHTSHGALLSQIPLGAAIHTARLLGVALAHGAEQAVTQLSENEVALATNKGMGVLQCGALGVRKALDSIVDPHATGIYSAYGRLANSLIYNAGDDYQAIKELVIEHASSRFMLRSGRLAAGNQTWTSATQLARIMGSTKDKVRRRLYETGITNSMNSETVLVSAVSDLLNDDPTEIVKTKTACEIIACDKDMFDSLVETGLIKRAYEPARKTTRKRAFQGNFRRSELVAFRRSVEGRAQSHLTDDMITLRLAARRSGTPKATILAGILSGEYNNVALSGKALMADNVMIDFRELDPWGDFVTALQAAILLAIRTDTVAKLLAHGVIPYREANGLNQRFPRKMINRRDIAAFVGKYVSIAQLVEQTGLDRNLINAKMRSRNVRPAFPPAEFKTAFILRSDVERLLEGIALGRSNLTLQ
ncbi:TniQ family protein [Rhizobium leguminosarum]|uniref:TniQ family protein n=1 Tax=Rhizobium leguminosarum TaxID=384 RepID=UPI0024B3BA14|nr:TniQ family protein [Rhizobium leguminosarum]WHO84168.1 TniQ family protein [Rhizobium leguminosarum]